MKISVKHHSNKRGVVLESPGPCSVWFAQESEIARLGFHCIKDMTEGKVPASTTMKVKSGRYWKWTKIDGFVRFVSATQDGRFGVVFESI
jgi:hypothetical protein